MSVYREQLKSTQFSQFFAALRFIRSNPNALNVIDSETIDYICRAFELYRFGFEDILEMKRKVLVVLNRHIDSVNDRSLIKGVKRYVEGYLRREHDSSGFIYVAGCIKIAAKIDLDKIMEVLAKDSPDDVEILKEYKSMLRKMESASHNAYYILRIVGYQFLDNLEKIIHRLTPSSQDTILHSLEGFTGNKDVIAFYKRYMEKAAFEWLRDDAENYLNSVSEKMDS